MSKPYIKVRNIVISDYTNNALSNCNRVFFDCFIGNCIDYYKSILCGKL